MNNNTINTHTYREVMQQPQAFLDTYEVMKKMRNELLDSFKKNNIDKKTQVILSGAGSSAYLADAMVCLYKRSGYTNIRSVATTDIITNPEFYLDKTTKLVDVSFGRSGDSPESVASYDVINKFCKDPFHIIITCNKNGALAKETSMDNTIVIVLPDQTNDVSLVMTSSFTSMTLAGLLLKDIETIDSKKEKVEEMSKFSSNILNDRDISKTLEKITNLPIERAVFLGTGPLKGLARECHLKLQEMTDGKIICSYDSFLGLRHGPKAVIKSNTLVVYLFSDDEYTRKYEIDLFKQVNVEHKPAAQIVLSRKRLTDDLMKNIDLQINDTTPSSLAENEYKYIPFVHIGQILGYKFSVKNGFNPDNPSVSGTIHRVVDGVKIYKY